MTVIRRWAWLLVFIVIDFVITMHLVMSGIYFCSKKSNRIRLSAEGFDMYRHSDRFFSFIKPATHYKLTIGKIQSVGRCDLLMRISDWALSIPMNATSQMHAATNLHIYSINRQTVKQTDWTSATLMYRSSTLRCIVWAVIYQGNLSATPLDVAQLRQSAVDIQ